MAPAPVRSPRSAPPPGRRGRRLGWWAGLATGVASLPLLPLSGPTAAAAEPDEPVPAAPAALVPLQPCRLLDTRLGERPGAGTTVRIEASGRCGLPDDASSVVVTLTVAGADAAGFLTGWDGAGERPEVSNLNYRAGDTRANTAVLPLHDGAFSLYTQASTDLVVDVAGAFVPRTASTAGRLVAITPVRVTDTRLAGALPAGSTVRVPLPEGVPADAVAVAVTLTTSGGDPGYFTAAPAGAPLPEASVLNTDGPGQTRAVGAILPVSPDGLDIHTSAGAPVIADVTGYFTGPSASRGTDGLFVAEAPRRLVDTRSDTPVYAGGTIVLDTGPAAAAVLNVTMTANRGAGYLSAVPAAAGTPPDATSSVNSDRRMATAASLAVVPASTAGVAVRSSVTSHAIVDVFGTFTGAPMPTTTDPATLRNDPVTDPPVRALLVGDSTMAAIRWYGSSRAALAGEVSYTLDAQSCRRLVVPSCRGREGVVPITVAQVIERLTQPVDVLVVQAGYDDMASGFASYLDRVVTAARAKGIGQVIWLNYREDASYVFVGFPRSLGNGYATMNAILRERASAYPELIVADYDGYTQDATTWFESDGIHLTRVGAFGVADYISRWVAAANALPCPAPAAPGETPPAWCPAPDTHPAVDVRALYQL